MKRFASLLIIAGILTVIGCSTDRMFLRKSPNALTDDNSIAVTVHRANELEQQDDWAGAMALYRTALRQKAKDKELKVAYTGFQKRRHAYLARLDVDRLIAKAGWIKKQRSYQLAAKGSGSAEKKKIKIIAGDLLRIGKDAMKRKDFRLAKRALSNAEKLHSTSATKAAKKQLRKQMKLAKKRSRETRSMKKVAGQ